MSAKITCVIMSCIALLITFFTFCYLLSIVNPERTFFDTVDTAKPETSPDVAELSSMKLRYGLDKLSKEELEAIHLSFPFYVADNRRKMADLHQLLGPNATIVEPPMWVNNATNNILTELEILIKKQLNKNETNNTVIKTTNASNNTAKSVSELNVTEKNKTVMKTNELEPKINRLEVKVNKKSNKTESKETNSNRSDIENKLNKTERLHEPKALNLEIHKSKVNDTANKRNSNDTGSVVLKILDNSGNSRVEIKLGPNVSIKNKTQIRMNRSLKDSWKYNIELENDIESEGRNVLPKDSVIQVLPNDTILVEETDDLNLL